MNGGLFMVLEWNMVCFGFLWFFSSFICRFSGMLVMVGIL